MLLAGHEAGQRGLLLLESQLDGEARPLRVQRGRVSSRGGADLQGADSVGQLIEGDGALIEVPDREVKQLQEHQPIARGELQFTRERRVAAQAGSVAVLERAAEELESLPEAVDRDQVGIPRFRLSQHQVAHLVGGAARLHQ